MKQTDIPTKFNVPWAQLAVDPTYRRTIPLAPTGTPGQASLQQGFPTETFVPVASGGTPPWGNDFNGVLYQISNLLVWLMSGAPIFYDSALATATSGYPKGSVVAQVNGPVGYFWISEVDDNTGDPDAGAPNWGQFSVLSSATTGETHFRPTGETVAGCVRCNGNTVGDAFSNASERANADCYQLFTWVWENFTDAQCPMFTSTGGAVARGAFNSAQGDWEHHCAITLPDMRGSWPGGVDDMGNVAAGRFNTAFFGQGSSIVPGSRGNFVQPTSGGTNNVAFFQTGSWYVRL